MNWLKVKGFQLSEKCLSMKFVRQKPHLQFYQIFHIFRFLCLVNW